MFGGFRSSRERNLQFDLLCSNIWRQINRVRNSNAPLNIRAEEASDLRASLREYCVRKDDLFDKTYRRFELQNYRLTLVKRSCLDPKCRFSHLYNRKGK